MAKELSISIKVRFRDLDALGHLNYAVYLTYMEEASNALWQTVLEQIGRPMLAHDLGYVSARAEIDYRSPAHCGETVKVTIWVSAVGRSSFTTCYRIGEAEGARRVADAKTVQVVTVPGSEPGRMPDEIRTALVGLMEGVSEASR